MNSQTSFISPKVTLSLFLETYTPLSESVNYPINTWQTGNFPRKNIPISAEYSQINP